MFSLVLSPRTPFIPLAQAFAGVGAHAINSFILYDSTSLGIVGPQSDAASLGALPSDNDLNRVGSSAATLAFSERDSRMRSRVRSSTVMRRFFEGWASRIDTGCIHK